MALTMTLIDGVYHLKGTIDEFLGELETNFNPGPLAFNLKAIDSINSQGILLFLRFMEDLSGRPVEFHECSPVVVDMINTFPGILGVPHRPEIVKSMYAEFRCVGCAKHTQNLVKITGKMAFKIEGETVCSRCGEQLEMEIHPDELLVFHTDLNS